MEDIKLEDYLSQDDLDLGKKHWIIFFRTQTMLQGKNKD